MYHLVVLASVLVCVFGAPRSLHRPREVLGERIIGGEQIAIERVPYQLSFEEFARHECGASIISVDWAVTAAHCVKSSSAENIRLRSGSSRRGEGGVLHDVIEIIINEKYDPYIFDYDIAVMKVAKPFKVDAATAIVSLAEVAPSTDTIAFVSGWGSVTSGSSLLPVDLRGVGVPIYDQEWCDKEYEDQDGITSRMICAGMSTGGKDACQGDSGGPLVVDDQLVGIVSWGIGCGLAGYPGVYSNVAVLRSWVIENAGL